MNRYARPVVTTSFVVTAILGAVVIFNLPIEEATSGQLAAIVAMFVAIMGCVHVAGYIAYAGQFREDRDEHANPHAALAVFMSFCAMAILCGCALFAAATRHGVTAIAEPALFLLVLSGVHLGGYKLYIRQFVPQADGVARRPSYQLAPAYWPALKFAVILDGFLLLLTSLILDGGRSFAFYSIAFVAHWMGITVVMWRRPSAPTLLDRVFIRWGVVLLWILMAAIAPLVWSIIGESHLSGWQRLMSA